MKLKKIFIFLLMPFVFLLSTFPATTADNISFATNEEIITEEVVATEVEEIVEEKPKKTTRKKTKKEE